MHHSFKEIILYFGAARCGLKSLDSLETFKKLRYLDARNNSITSIFTLRITLGCSFYCPSGHLMCSFHCAGKRTIWTVGSN